MSSTSNAVLTADSIWLDGKIVPWAQGQVPIMTHALHYGLGVFEGLRAYRTHDGRLAVFRLREHMKRFADSCHIIQLQLPYTEDQLCEACLEVLRVQRQRFAGGAYLRPIAFMGDGAMGLGAVNPTRVAVTAWDWGAYLGDKGMREAILLDIAGFVAEASGENIFMVNKKDIVRTPPLSSPILAGITRRSVLRILKDMGHPVEEVTFTRDAVYISNEVFFTGTAAEITPVREVDNRRIGTGAPGPVVKMIQDMYFRVVRGQEPRYAECLTYV